MVKRLDNLSSWKPWADGSALVISGHGPHKVTLCVNTETDAAFVCVFPDDRMIPLGTVSGMETFVFTAPPGAEVRVTSDGAVWYFTNEGDNVVVESLADTFVRLATRRERNPALELMLFKQEQNMQRREALLQGQIDALRVEQAARAAVEGADPETGEVIDEPAAVSDDPPAAGDTGATLQVAAVEPAATSTKKGVRSGATATA